MINTTNLSPIEGRTKGGLRFKLYVREYVGFESAVDVPEKNITQMHVRLTTHEGQPALKGNAYMGKKNVVVTLLPDAETLPKVIPWMDTLATEIVAEEKAKLNVYYWGGGEGHTTIVDSRMSDDEIIANFSDRFWYEENTPEAFRGWLQEARQKAAEKEAKKAERKAVWEKKKIDALAEAKTTGKDVLIASRMEPCDGSVCECNNDIVSMYMQPNGEIREIRVHTY